MRALRASSARHLDELALGDAQRLQRGARVEGIEADGVEVWARFAAQAARRPWPAERHAAEEDVLGGRQRTDHARFLRGDRDAGCPGTTGIAEHDRLAVDRDRAVVRRVQPRQNLHQRALAGAVLADQRHHLAGAQLEVHAVERLDRAEAVAHPRHLQDDRRRHRAVVRVGVDEVAASRRTTCSCTTPRPSGPRSSRSGSPQPSRPPGSACSCTCAAARPATAAHRAKPWWSLRPPHHRC